MCEVREGVIQPRFAEGTRVRVKAGVMDPDFPEMHLGDWTGTVSEVRRGGLPGYLIRWNPETLENVHPACREYCAKEDVALDKMWLLEGDLEPAPEARLPRKRRKEGPLAFCFC